MIEELDTDLEDFSQVNRIRCFLHIVNLIAKSLLKQFDVPAKRPSGDLDEEVDEQLQELAREFNLEEATTQAFDNSDGDDDDVDGIVDAGDLFSAHEKAAFEADVRPVQLTLAKVSFRADRVRARELSRLLSNPAAKTCIQGHPFDDYPLASVERNRAGNGDGRSYHAA
jgi:hypothetical protein